MKDPLKIAIVCAGVVCLVCAAVLVGMRTGGGSEAGEDPAKPDQNVTDLAVPAFSFTAQDGSTVTGEAFKGRVTVLDFTFTRCTLICPKMTGTMFELTQRLKEPAVQYLSISVDPEHDTPGVLAEYAKAFDAAPPRWRFLSGDKKVVYSILRDGLKFGIKENPPLDLGGGKTAPDIRHPAHFVLVGPDGRVLGLYNSDDEEAVGKLERRARAVAGKIGR